jgi:hypothetical protein
MANPHINMIPFLSLLAKQVQVMITVELWIPIRSVQVPFYVLPPWTSRLVFVVRSWDSQLDSTVRYEFEGSWVCEGREYHGEGSIGHFKVL